MHMDKTQDTFGRGLGRRVFLKASAAVAVLTAIPEWLWAAFVDRLQVRTVEKKNFRFDSGTGQIAWTDRKVKEPYYLKVDGLVDKPLRFSYDELKALPQANQVSDFHCVEGWSVRDIRWGGFRFSEILKRVKIKPDARFVVFHSIGKTDSSAGGLDHYAESFAIEELIDPGKERLLALSMDGKPLPHDHGAPLRVVCPYYLGYKGSKFVERIEFARERKSGWWTLANPVYPVDAPVPKDRLRKSR